MYVIRMDGRTLYSPSMMGSEYRVLAPKISLDVNANGSCSFVLPPGHYMHGDVRRRRSIVTVCQDGEEIFRGHVLDETTDSYKQKDVYCEGTRAYLSDSEAAPYKYSGTPRGLLKKLIDEHNEQTEEEKRFALGNVTIDRADEDLECENTAYRKTYQEIDEKLLSAYGGYLKVRTEGGVQYIDWLKEYSSAQAKEIRFGVNLLDIQDKRATGDMFTILRPLGASKIGSDGAYGAALTIASVNGGKDYIEDEEAVAKYGRIWKTQTWPHEESPAKLLEKGREYLKIGAELRTITLKAVDMHFITGSADAIRIGDKVHIVSNPHGIDMEKTCSRIEIDLVNPENTTYTFGEAPRALTDNIVAAEKEIDTMTGYKGGGGGRGTVKDELQEILRWARIVVDEANANIGLNAGEINKTQQYITRAGIDINGALANVKIMATKEALDEQGERISGAEVEIDGLNSEIILKADKVYVDAEITEVKTLIADEIEAVYADIHYSIADSVSTGSLTVSGSAWVQEKLTAGSVSTGSLKIDGSSLTQNEKTVISGGSCSFESTQKTVVDASGNAIGYVYVPTKVTFTPSGKSTINYWGY